MPQWLQFLLHNAHFTIFAIVALAGVFRSIAKSLEKKAKERQADLDRQRREVERLRTGREPEAAPVTLGASFPTPTAAGQASARQQLEELAAKRQRAFEDLQRRRAASGVSTPQSTQPRPTTPEQLLATILGAPGTVPKPTPAPPRSRPQTTPTRQAPAPRPVQRQRPTPTPRPTSAPTAQPRAQRPVAPAPAPVAAPTAEEPAARKPMAQPEAPEHTPAPARDPLGIATMDRAAWKRAFLMREIFDRPVSLREA